MLAMQLAACLQAEAGQLDEQTWHLLLHGCQAESAGQQALQGAACLAACSEAAWDGFKVLEDLAAFQVCAWHALQVTVVVV